MRATKRLLFGQKSIRFVTPQKMELVLRTVRLQMLLASGPLISIQVLPGFCDLLPEELQEGAAALPLSEYSGLIGSAVLPSPSAHRSTRYTMNDLTIFLA